MEAPSGRTCWSRADVVNRAPFSLQGSPRSSRWSDGGCEDEDDFMDFDMEELVSEHYKKKQRKTSDYLADGCPGERPEAGKENFAPCCALRAVGWREAYGQQARAVGQHVSATCYGVSGSGHQCPGGGVRQDEVGVRRGRESPRGRPWRPEATPQPRLGRQRRGAS